MSLSYNTIVKPEWIDHNGHMNVAYFVVAFDESTDAAYEEWGIGLAYPEQTGCSVFTLGMNVDYLGELFEGDSIRIDTTLLEFDDKRIHYFHEMYRNTTDSRVATNECLAMNVNLSARKSEAFPESIRQYLESVQIPGEFPDRVARKLEIRR